MSESVIEFYRRGSEEREQEIIYGERFIKFGYQDANMRGFRSLAFRWATLSRGLGWYFGSRLSRPRVRAAIEQLGIDESEFLDSTESYRSFHDFFTRKLKPEARPFDPAPTVLASPADGRTLLYPRLDGATVIPVKGCNYSVDDLLARPANDFYDGACLVVRLCPADYHRYHFPADATVLETWDLPGVYHSVNPLALSLGINIFCENKRRVTLLDSPQFGRIAYLEVGAFGVGSIVDTYSGTQVAKMDEKGYFTFGGSTLALLFQKGRVRWSDDLMNHSADGYETLIKVGETIGTAP